MARIARLRFGTQGPERVQTIDHGARTGRDSPTASSCRSRHHALREHDPADKSRGYPASAELERRIRASSLERDGDGSRARTATFMALAVTLHVRIVSQPYEVAMNHFFRGRGESGYDGDQIYFQGHRRAACTRAPS